MEHLCVYAKSLPSSRATVHPVARVSAISQPVSRTWRLVRPWGWSGLGARVELGGWCGSRVPDRKIRYDETCGSQTINRLVAAIETAFPTA